MIPLSPVDHVFTGRGAYPIEFVFAYDGRIDEGRLEEQRIPRDRADGSPSG